MLKRYSLGHSKAREIHKQIVNHPNSYSLTITLKPYYNSFPIHEQHRYFQQDLNKMFERLDRYYNKAMISPEVTKRHNLHYHCYFILPDEVDHIVFEQNFKLYRYKKTCIGPDYKLKKVDEITDTLLNYPFKDINRTTMYSNIVNCLFQPTHTCYSGRNSWKII